MVSKIISGGQTGVDRAALDVALEHGVPCGGFCPKGRQAEDGVINPRYPLKEIEQGYRQRTLLNVMHSDATLIIYNDLLSGGTEQTLKFCIQHEKPYKLVDMALATKELAANAISKFLRDFNVSTLNVAGPRASGEPRAYDYTRRVLEIVVSNNM